MIKIEVEKSLIENFDELKDKNSDNLDDLLYLFRGSHMVFFEASLFNLGKNYQILDASRPWLVYWLTHSISLLARQDLLNKHATTIANFLKTCENQTTGGYGGSPGNF